MQAIDVLHEVAALTIALLAIRGLQAIVEHFFPSSEAAAVGRFIYGGP